MDWTSTWAGIVEFLKSPGFGAAGAAVAGYFAFRSATQRTRWETWWERAQWALDKACDSDPRASAAGLAALLALVDERGIPEDRKDWLIAAVDPFLPLDAPDALPEAEESE